VSREPVILRVVQGEAEAQQLLAFLRANGIRAAVRAEALRITHGFTLDGLGQVEIVVHPGDLEAARELLAAAEAGELELPG